MRRERLLLAGLLATVGLLTSPGVALAGKGEDAFGAIVVLPLLLALFLYPTGLALHALILALAPRRGAELVRQARGRPIRALLLGGVNVGALLALAALAGRKAWPVGVFALLLGLILAFVGSHGVARALGRRVLGPGGDGAAGADLKALATGWFVLVFGTAFPLFGWLLGGYFALRSVGALALALLGAPEPEGDPPGDLLGP